LFQLSRWAKRTSMTASRTLGAGSSSNPSPHVLVVDDEPAVARVSERVLSSGGFRVTLAPGGKEAIEKARAVPFDAILSDVCMPDVAGHAVLRAVGGSALDIPFVFLTGSPQLESAIEAVEFAAFRYLVKPVRSLQLLD